ncbi:long-chain fatty acid--CoA ligase [Hydrogenibacillus schlegelii]|uniref:Long-chain fatty acid--CoA ligase n=1 Tax=Hydrogenibacillus schlegelii TaxID=1484 RepID=A0A179IM82_HYDSH|nr:long-chain fatty acid--CoA ligase [Hydrogenibacillus schlegelii]OAR03787.1 long-chain fatty acid--CoA ligase [Hydrogenibacillus schlegelii]
MQGLMMDFPLTLTHLLRRAETLFPRREIVDRRPDRTFFRYTYAEFIDRAKRLAVALRDLGLARGDRVATLMWNQHEHLEAYFGIPLAGAVLHTLNLRLPPEDLRFIIEHADDRALIVDQTLLPLLEKIGPLPTVRHVFVAGVPADASLPEGLRPYEALLAGADPARFVEPELDERDAAAMCYTSGTTGRPKGVVYSHRALVLHSIVSAMADGLGVRESDAVLPVVPMFHVNAWGLPYTTTLVGAKHVLPGMHLDPASLLEAFQAERVTLTAGVPTIWLGVLQRLDQNPGAYDLSALRALLVGGAAAPAGMIRGFQERHGLTVVHAWGMTETTPLGTIAFLSPETAALPEDARYRLRAKQGRPVPLVEIRARGPEGFVPWNGEAMGELEVRGPWIAAAYHNAPEAADRWTDDGWFRTGDIVTIDPHGYVEIKDRDKDLVKSGGEWISTMALENALMTHPAVLEAAVIAVPHPKWQERPLAVVVLKPGHTPDEAMKAALFDALRPKFARWQLPDDIVFVDQIPRTSTGKFLKRALRERFKHHLDAQGEPIA